MARLPSLSRVPEQLEMAIETAMGGALQHVVMEDEKVSRHGDRVPEAASARAGDLPAAGCYSAPADYRQ